MMRSPDFSSVGEATLTPLSMVPFLLPRSLSAQPEPVAFDGQMLAGKAVIVGEGKVGGAGAAERDALALKGNHLALAVGRQDL